MYLCGRAVAALGTKHKQAPSAKRHLTFLPLVQLFPHWEQAVIFLDK